ncbi:MAG: L,D-transpeptidase family protein [Sphingomonas sp.]
MRRARIPFLLLLATALAPATALPRPAAKKAATKPAAPKPSPAARAVAVAIRAQAGGAARPFYAGRGFWPLWAADGHIGGEASAFVTMLEQADRDRLDPAKYDPAGLAALLAAAKGKDPAAVARAEVALSNALARYVGDLRRPAKTGALYLDATLKPRRPRAAEVLAGAAAVSDFPAYVRGAGWASPHYLRLRDALDRNRSALTPEERGRAARILDRARMLPSPWVRHIVVDAASARLFAYEGGRQRAVMRVVAGAAETPTPMLAGHVRYAILNPYWNVPTDLAARRIAPKIVAGASLAALRYEALSGWTADAAPIAQSAVDWEAVAAGKREVRLRQLPGGDNAMGKVKFMFPNDQGIFLHDTPDKALMTKPDRHLSNGCVRLEDAPALGRWLLGKPLTAWPKRPEQAVPLERPVPVHLTYLPATSTDAGLAFLPDVYARDGRSRAVTP